ncbi:MAG: LysM peptidoglycan-binding domain-containing protein [Lentisphaerae bacterium]|jgi:LysM repeat protein|nr:LysM peptidoglycan-binding domain-containing protein [Lentisphaerota bacterium]MBT4816892.1 LysM peptidoglycan-binding domain-containing protein [Lentisphaerota bacterium]MBT5606837.1 LysM peptidoglycan-binding domain-containing protein [Lentisphaerota bacterium]MBT7055305.1 LysM peptidoglycan-binding domain-containing protein [Lentisphaerota bacterium]MBT7843086.1 LysM peptidoglycan-binding domain-containing protein [Lentisphaerota bacterium]
MTKTIRSVVLSAGLGVVTLGVGGCVLLEPAGGQDVQMAQQQRLSRDLAEMRRQQHERATHTAALQSDVRAVHELRAKVIALAEDNQAQAQRVQELERRVVAAEGRVQALSNTMTQQVDRLRSALAEEEQTRKKSVSEVIKIVSQTVEGAVRNVQRRVAPPPTAKRTYTVVRGDTLSAISTAFGVSIDAIKKANNLKGDTIREGQALTIPSP